MEKQQNLDINYKSLSENEAYLLESVKSQDLLVFGVDEIKALSDWKKTRIHNTLSSLNKKGHIIRIKKDTYSLEEEFFDKTFQVITEAVKPSYISFWTALSYHGLTEQQVNVIQLVSTKQFDNIKVRNKKIEISSFKPKRFFGYDEIDGTIMAVKEKALVDSLYMLHKIGGLEEYNKCLKNAYDGLDKKTFREYVIEFDNRSLVSRIGYLLDVLDLAEIEFLDTLNGHISESYILLDPHGGSVKTHNSDWNIKINRDMEALL
ncbi:MAG: type IV toxin-antitoxin system AbiEi family antitoxin domain-containing protein [Thermoplasmatota archaeon]